MTAAKFEFIDVEQGSEEWLELRKIKITATDASVIMGASHWKTKTQLYNEKVTATVPNPPNERMQRGTALEPVARDLFNLTYKKAMEPKVCVRGWAMASLDGMSKEGEILEIKCPGERDHAIAVSGKVPSHYYPQLQHQMFVCDANKVYYYSFDGFEGVLVIVERDEEYIERMLKEEAKFYSCIVSKTPPEQEEEKYIERMDEEWEHWAQAWRSVTSQIKDLETQEEELRKRLVLLSGSSNTKGGGISLCQVQRKGNVDYAKIPQLQGVDLEPYRKGSVSSWRITCS